jgi:hypothetical protein
MSAAAGRRIVQCLLLIGLFVGAYLALTAFDHAARADDSASAADRPGLGDPPVRVSGPRADAGEILAKPRAAKADSTTGRKSPPARAEKPPRVERPTRVERLTRVEKPARVEKPVPLEKPSPAGETGKAVRAEKSVRLVESVRPVESVRTVKSVRVVTPVRAEKPELLKIRKQRISDVVQMARTVRQPVVLREATAAVRHLTGHTVPAAVAALPGMLSGVPAAGPAFSVLPASRVTWTTSAPTPASGPALTPASAPTPTPALAPAPAPTSAPVPAPGSFVMYAPPAFTGVESSAARAAARPRGSEDGPRPASPPHPGSPCATASHPRDAGGGTSPMSAVPASWWPGLRATAVLPSTNANTTGRSVRYCGPPS